MKIKAKDFAALQQAILPLDIPSRREKYQDMSPQRYWWDTLVASGFDTRPLYTYLNDGHIETALRKILK